MIKKFEAFIAEAWGTDNKCDNCAAPLDGPNKKCAYCGVIPIDKVSPSRKREDKLKKTLKIFGVKMTEPNSKQKFSK